jgi:predicted metal-binding protein
MPAKKDKLVELQNVCRIHGTQPAVAIADDCLEAIEQMAKQLGFREIQLLHTQEIVIARWVGLKCRYGCSNFGTSWCCPPAAPDIETIRELLSEYELALLLTRENTSTHFYRNSNEKRRGQIKQWKATIALERKLFLMGYYKAFGLPAETCALCKECAYPRQCRFPNEKRPSIEACAIDVFQTLNRLGRTACLARNVSDAYLSHSLILLA